MMYFRSRLKNKQCSDPPRVTLTNGGDLVGLLQHPFLPGVKGSDTVCRKMRGNLGCKLKVKPRIIWAALTRRVVTFMQVVNYKLSVFKTEICEAFGGLASTPKLVDLCLALNPLVSSRPYLYVFNVLFRAFLRLNPGEYSYS